MNLGCGRVSSGVSRRVGSRRPIRFATDTEQSFLQQVGPSACAELFAAPDRT